MRDRVPLGSPPHRPASNAPLQPAGERALPAAACLRLPPLPSTLPGTKCTAQDRRRLFSRPVIPGRKALVLNVFPSVLKTMKDQEFAVCI